MILIRYSISLPSLGEECEGNVFGSVRLSVCMSVWTHNSKTSAPIKLIFYARRIIPVAWSSSNMIWIGTQEYVKGFFTIVG